MEMIPISEKGKNNKSFEDIKHIDKHGVEFWYARELIRVLQYSNWQNFEKIIDKAKISADRHILVSNQYDTKDTVRTSKSRRIAKVCDYIEKNFEEPIKLGDVAQLVNMSESAFSHFFKKKTNCTFIDYITNLRIARACQLLAETTHTVAPPDRYTCGFNNLSNFIRIFKKKKGSTPQEYRMFLQQMLIKY